ncbi:MAG TPA: SGNH/GDSL hydrolase family protein [Planctomycetota bacterium]|nr:SGNH/GDSL hydrolase family protein [Planctomycetota bacterium]
MHAKHLFLTIVLSVVAALSHAGEEAEFRLKNEERIVFFGDSITAGGRYIIYIESYLATRFPERAYTLINSGKGSETLSGLSEVDHPGRRPHAFARFTQFVADFDPTLIVSCYGMNDGIYHPFSEERFGKYKEGVKMLIDRVRQETKARLNIITPPVFDSKNPGQPDVRPEESYGYKQPFADYDQVLEKFSEFLMTLKEDGVFVTDLHTPMKEHIKTRRIDTPAFRVQGDMIHPDNTGHMLMALAILKGWNAPSLASEAVIDVATNKVMSGDVRDLKSDAGGLELSWTAKLPAPNDRTWDMKSVELAKWNESLNRHTLKITGLTHLSYKLFADDVEVATLSKEDLERGVDLTRLEKFPTTAASAALLPLLEERRKTGYANLRKTPAANPKRSELDKKIADVCRPKILKIRLVPQK